MNITWANSILQINTPILLIANRLSSSIYTPFPSILFLSSNSRSTSTLHFATNATITPKALSHGANATVAITPAVPQVTGMDIENFTFIILDYNSFNTYIVHQLFVRYQSLRGNVKNIFSYPCFSPAVRTKSSHFRNSAPHSP